MKKWSKIAVSTFVSLIVLSSGFASANEMKTMVDYSKVPVVMKAGLELVPLRQVAESLGYQVTWNQNENSVTLIYGGMMNGMISNENMGNMMDMKPMDSTMINGMMPNGNIGSNMMGMNSMDSNMADKSKTTMPYTVKIKINIPEAWVGMSGTKLSYAPVIINNRTYVTKDFIDMYISKQMMMK